MDNFHFLKAMKRHTCIPSYMQIRESYMEASWTKVSTNLSQQRSWVWWFTFIILDNCKVDGEEL
jgi:hypothetical protein